MAEEKKRLTAAELRNEQEQREKAGREAEAQAKQDAQTQREERVQQQQRALADGIKADWYDGVLAAANRTGIRFLVLAVVISDGARLPIITEIIESIQSHGYGCEVVSLQSAARGGTATVFDDKTEAEVLIGAVKGWKPPNLPRFGGNGPVTYLIVKW